MLEWLLGSGVQPDWPIAGPPNDWDSNTPLMHAAAEGDVVALKLLIQSGANLEAVNESNENAFGYACAWGQLEAIRVLADAGCDVNDLVDSGPERTQLDWAELCGKDDVVSLLRELGGKTFTELSAV